MRRAIHWNDVPAVPGVTNCGAHFGRRLGGRRRERREVETVAELESVTCRRCLRNAAYAGLVADERWRRIPRVPTVSDAERSEMVRNRLRASGLYRG